jgi:hypothetical protein
MSETPERSEFQWIQWSCPWHGYVDTWPCPFCPQVTIVSATTAGMKLITEAELEMRLEAARRSYEARWNDQRTAVARMLAESTQELRQQIGGLLDRLADQDTLIAQLRSDLDRQSRLDDLTYEIACATEVLTLRQREQIRGLRARLAELEQRLAAPML